MKLNAFMLRKTLFELLLPMTLILCWSSTGLASDYQLKMEQLSQGVYRHISYLETEQYGMVSSNGMVVFNEGAAYIIDTPWTEQDTENLLVWIAAHGAKVRGAVVTHFHADRAAGLSVLNRKGIPTFAHQRTNDILKSLGQASAVNSMGGDQVEWGVGMTLFYPGAGHSEDNIVVWLAEQNILFGGCFIKSDKSKSLGNLSDAVVGDWGPSLQKTFVQFDLTTATVVPGHGSPGDVTLLTHTQALVDSYLARQQNH